MSVAPFCFENLSLSLSLARGDAILCPSVRGKQCIIGFFCLRRRRYANKSTRPTRGQPDAWRYNCKCTYVRMYVTYKCRLACMPTAAACILCKCDEDENLYWIVCCVVYRSVCIIRVCLCKCKILHMQCFSMYYHVV